MNAMLISRCVFSITFAASATRIEGARCVPAVMMLAYRSLIMRAASGVDPDVYFTYPGYRVLLIARIDSFRRIAYKKNPC